MSEWELLIQAEAIKIGDRIIVELENGETVVWRLVKFNDKSVYLRNNKRELVRFIADTLESKFDYLVIIGKA
jgi:hypothetical protein